MQTGIFLCFITSAELKSRIDQVRQQENLYLILARFRSAAAVEVVAPKEQCTLDSFPDAIFLSPSKPQVDGLSFNDLGPLAFEEGWVYILPRPVDDENNNLYLTSVTFKSANDGARLLFQRVKKILKKGLRFGVRVAGPDGDQGRISRKYEYSQEAERLYKDGVHWRQRGVHNSWFAPAI